MTIDICVILLVILIEICFKFAYSAFMLLFGCREEHPGVKNTAPKVFLETVGLLTNLSKLAVKLIVFVCIFSPGVERACAEG